MSYGIARYEGAILLGLYTSTEGFSIWRTVSRALAAFLGYIFAKPLRELIAVDRVSSDTVAVCQHAEAYRWTVASVGIAEAVGVGKSIQRNQGRRGVCSNQIGKALSAV